MNISLNGFRSTAQSPTSECVPDELALICLNSKFANNNYKIINIPIALIICMRFFGSAADENTTKIVQFSFRPLKSNILKRILYN